MRENVKLSIAENRTGLDWNFLDEDLEEDMFQSGSYGEFSKVVSFKV